MKKLAIAICILLTNGLFAAAPISISGQGTASYTNLFGKPDKSVENQAKAKAVNDAINRALENQPEALRQQFKSAGSNIPLDDYFSKKLVTEISTILVNDDKGEKTITVRFEGKLDIAGLRDALNAMPKGENQAPAVNRSSDKVAVFFTVRQTTGVVIHNPNVKKEGSRSSSDASNSEAQGDVSATDSGVSKTETSLKQKKTQTKENSSGSVTLKSNTLLYELDAPSREIFGNGLAARFLNKGVKKVKNGKMFKSSQDLDNAYGSGNVVEADVWEKVVAEVRQKDPTVKYLIVGTLDFSASTIDSITGQYLYNGPVAGDVYELAGEGIPDSISALAPMEAKESAPTEQDARKRVVAKLAELAADEIITTLRNNDIL